MLNDWEQQTLSEIERELLRHDPGLAQKFSPSPVAPTRCRRGRVLDTFIGIITLVSAFEVLVGSYSPALGLMAMAAAAAWVGYGSGATKPRATGGPRSRLLPPGAPG